MLTILITLLVVVTSTTSASEDVVYNPNKWHMAYDMTCNEKCATFGLKCDAYQTKLLSTEERVLQVFTKVASSWEKCIQYEPSSVTGYVQIYNHNYKCYYFDGDIIDAQNSCSVRYPQGETASRLCACSDHDHELVTNRPTGQPSGYPSGLPSSPPTVAPTMAPTRLYTAYPTSEPSGQPTVEPTSVPTLEPTGKPTAGPTSQPSSVPTGKPTKAPVTVVPSGQPSSAPSQTESPTQESNGDVNYNVNNSSYIIDPTLGILITIVIIITIISALCYRYSKCPKIRNRRNRRNNDSDNDNDNNNRDYNHANQYDDWLHAHSVEAVEHHPPVHIYPTIVHATTIETPDIENQNNKKTLPEASAPPSEEAFVVA